MEDAFGPALPPHLLKQTKQSTSETVHRSCDRQNKDKSSSGSSDSDLSSADSDSDQDHPKIVGPVIPKGLQISQDTRLSGPQLPPGFRQVTADDSDPDEGFGPQPPVPGQYEGRTAAEEMEQRASKMKHKLIHGSEESAPKRDTWMTELPSVGLLAKHMGLKARKLGEGSKVKDEDQSVWTDTPIDRERKAQDLAEGKAVKRAHEEPVRSTRDTILAQQVAEYNMEKRQKSLLDMHTKKLKKKKKKEEKKRKKEKKKEKKKKGDTKTSDKPERRPFDRDVDLGASKFDDAQRKALVKRSQELNTKFSSGGQQFI